MTAELGVWSLPLELYYGKIGCVRGPFDFAWQLPAQLMARALICFFCLLSSLDPSSVRLICRPNIWVDRSTWLHGASVQIWPHGSLIYAHPSWYASTVFDCWISPQMPPIRCLVIQIYPIDYTRDEFIDYAALALLQVAYGWQIHYTEIAATAIYCQLLDVGGLGNQWPFSPPRNNMASN